MAQYKCTNFGNCEKADRSEITMDAGLNPHCTECGTTLMVENPDNSLILKIAGGVLALATLGGIGYGISQAMKPDPQPTPVPKPVAVVKPVEKIQTNQTLTNPAVIPPTPPTPPATACAIEPITAVTQPNWYAVIEIGAKGIKPIAVQFGENLAPIGFGDKFDTQDITPSEEISLPKVVSTVCDTVNKLHKEYGDLPIYLVGSSSMAQVAHKDRLVAALDEAVHEPVDFITAEQEASYLGKGIWANPNLPPYRHCESAVLDIGGGNIKGGYIENCDATVREGKDEKFASFEVPNFGVVKFTAQAQQKLDSKASPTFIEAAKKTREALEAKLDEQIRTRPELTNGKKRFYLAGGAVWIMNTLLCLDCPQYEQRSATDDQDKYTVIKPEDIDEFYRYVTTADKDVCDPQIENPYLRKDRDGGYAQPWSETRIEKQKAAIQKVCKKFKVPEELNSAAEILQALKNKMDFIHPNTHIFFMQNNLYTWSRQYLIEKIQQGKK